MIVSAPASPVMLSTPPVSAMVEATAISTPLIGRLSDRMDRLHLLAERRTFTHRSAQNVTGRDVRNVVTLAQGSALRALAGALLAQENNDETVCHHGLLQESLVVTHHELTVDLTHGLKGHSYGNQ